MKSTRNQAAMTLVEVIISMVVISMATGGILAALLQSRRLTEGSVVQASALTIVQGYIEQIKNMEMLEVVGQQDTKGVLSIPSGSYGIPTRVDETSTGLQPLWTSTGAIPDLSTLTPGVTPVGVVDNLRSFDIAKDATASSTTSTDTESGTAATEQIPWTTAWPGATTHPSGNVGRTDLKLNIWVWVTDLSGTTAMADQVFGVTMIYTWQYLDGGKPNYITGTVRTIRSTVPTI